ncbi:OmpH family outer membrane protein [bacterium]|jgi:Skp family chaperone for outer membrane proteins|nr:OmpH family outer membrane protein [bacterium]
MIKKTITLAILTLLLSGSVIGDNIGFIDMQRILTTYKGAIEIQTEIKKQREDYQSFFEEQQKKLEDAKKDNKSEEEVKKIVEEIQKEMRPKQEMLIQYEGMKQQGLLKEIISNVQDVRKEYGIDIVLDKQVVYDGGFDLTYFLLEKLNK